MNILATGATWQTWRQKSPAKEGGTEIEHGWYNRATRLPNLRTHHVIKNKPLEVKSLSLKFSVTCSPMQSLVSQRHHLYVHWVNPLGYKPRRLVVILASYLRMKLMQGKALLRDGQGLVATWAQCQALPEGRFSQWICHCGSFGLNQPELDFCNIKRGLIYGAKW